MKLYPTLMNLLNNGAYYNRTTGTYDNQGVIEVDFTQTGLTLEAKAMIGNAIWNLGGLSSSSTDSNYYGSASVDEWYFYERNDIVFGENPTEWTGQVGLMYPSDYGMATAGGTIYMDQMLCYINGLENWSSENNSECYLNDWLYSGTDQWTLTALSNTEYSVFKVDSMGDVSGDGPLNDRDVSPVVYLSSNVKITDGDGSHDNPFTLSL